MEAMNVTSSSNAIPIEQGNEFLEVRQSAIHGTGGYARRDIPTGTMIIDEPW